MAFQLDYTTRSNMALQLQTVIGSGGYMKVFSGAEPANCQAADPSGLLGIISLPYPFITAFNGQTTLVGTWTGNGSASGTAATFRMYDAATATCRAQGNCTTDMTFTYGNAVVPGLQLSVSGFLLVVGGA